MRALKRAAAVILAFTVICCSLFVSVGSVFAEETQPSTEPVPEGTQEPTEEPVVDLAPPELEVNIPNWNMWTNTVDDWTVNTSEGAEVYFKVSSSVPDDWGSYTDADALLWNGGSNLPEGNNYIKFWAVFPDSERPVNDSVETEHYQYDCTPPSAFEIKESFFYMNAKEPIVDSGSGVQDIYYAVNNDRLRTLEDIHQNASQTDVKEIEGRQKVNFSIPLNLYMKLQTVTVYVIDTAGNVCRVSSGKEVTADLDEPEFVSHKLISIEKDGQNNPKEAEKRRIEFGSDALPKSNLTKYYYISDNDYIKATIKEEHLKQVMLKATVGEKDYTATVSVKEMETPAGISKKEGVYYIPISALGQILRKNNVTDCLINKLVVSAEDTHHHTSDTDKNIVETDLFYDGYKADEDVVVQFDYGDVKKYTATDTPGLSANVAAYFSGPSMVNLTFDDDCGLQSYEVVISKLTSDNKKTPINHLSDKDLRTSEKSESIEYVMPRKEVKNLPLALKDDEKYVVDITVTDLAGNEKSISHYYIVDTAAPKIEDFSYKVEPDILRYFTFGIFGNDSIVVKIKITDGDFGAGFDLNEVKLTWDKKEPYTAVLNDGWYEFRNLPVDNTGEPYITLTDRLENESNYYFSTVIGAEEKPNRLLFDEETDVALTLESEPPQCQITPAGTGSVDGNKSYIIGLTEDDKTLYFGKSRVGEENNNQLIFTFSDNKGLEKYSITIKNDEGTAVRTAAWSFRDENKENNDAAVEKKQVIYLSDSEIWKSGRYTLEIEATDLAGNVLSGKDVVGKDGDISFDHSSFVIDIDAPTINSNEYTVKNTILNYMTFGIFGGKEIDISVGASDANSSIREILLYWDKAEPYDGKYDNETGKYVFEALPVNATGKPHVSVTDMLGNVNSYYFVTGKETGKLILNSPDKGVILMLEDKAPQAKVYVSDKYSAGKHLVGNEAWYGTDVQYMVYALDAEDTAEPQIQSGLNKVDVTLSDLGRQTTSTTSENSYNGSKFEDSAYTESALFRYPVYKEGHYLVSATVTDNAGNSKLDSDVFHIDLNAPKVVAFSVGDTYRNEPFFNNYYGYFFQKDTELRVYVADEGVSSGFNKVDIYLNTTQKNMKSYHFTTYGSDLHTDGNGVYAVCVIPAGFKGEMYAEVTDNVMHTSGNIKSDGSVLETGEIHSGTSSLAITPDIQASANDANQIPLYNTSVPITVTAVDTYSGIASVEWSIANDNESGVVSVDIKGNCTSNATTAVINNDSVKRDENLVTTLSFALSVDSNTNGNVIHVKLTDRSGNVTEAETKISIDTTAPTITAVKSNTNPANGNYYNTTQTVTVSITERNFNPSDAVVLVNGSAQAVSWNDAAPSFTTDDTVHTGTFTLSEDNRYIFSVSYTDMAGNAGTAFNEPEFVIDRTNPVVTNNFADFGNAGDAEIYYNIKNKGKAVANISVTEVNFLSEDMHLNIYYKAPGSSHSDDGWSEYPVPVSWTTSGNNHSLSIVFSEDGVYKITMSPVDRASNTGVFASGSNSMTAVFEVDFTAPVVYARNNSAAQPKDIQFMDVYDYERRKDDAPNVVFMDTNIEKIEYTLKTYLPEYVNGKEIETVKPVEKKDVVQTYANNSDKSQMIFGLKEFETDGIYSANIIAYDKAGNQSELNENTYIRMVHTKVLAYIENSNQETQTGWYSFEDENGPISKQPTSFSDLSIVVLSKLDDDIRVTLVDKATNDITDTKITDDTNAIFDDKMYSVGAYRYTLSGNYFAEHYTADADTSLYLRVNNGKKVLDLGEMNIDNTNPTCVVPENFADWAWIGGSGNKTIEFTNVSEILDSESTVAYVDGETVSIEDMKTEGSVNFAYDQAENKLSLTLEPGSHRAGLLLVDRAGNSTSIQEVQHLAIGNYRIWIIIGIIVGVLGCGALAFFLLRMIKRKKQG